MSPGVSHVCRPVNVFVCKLTRVHLSLLLPPSPSPYYLVSPPNPTALQADDGASRNERNWGRDPLDSLELEGCNPHQNRIIKALKLNQQVASASLPRHKAQLQHHFGALSAAVLAEALSGRPWGLPKVSVSVSVSVLCLCLFVQEHALFILALAQEHL